MRRSPLPNVANGRYDVTQAEATLRADGFTIGGVYGPGGTIVDTVPAAGVTVPYGSSIDIYVHNG